MQTHWEDLFSWKEKLMLANITLAYLSMDAFSTGPCLEADALTERLQSYHFLDYASPHWSHHARAAMVPQNVDAEYCELELVESVNRLLNNRMNL